MRYKIANLLDLDGNPNTVTIIYPRRSVFALSVHKAGSVLLEKVIQAIAEKAALPFCDFSPQLYSQGISEYAVSTEMLHVMDNPGVVYYGFRGLGLLSTVTNFRVGTKLLLIRDPRDIVVSMYHSVGGSHSIPETGAARAEVLNIRDKANAHDLNGFVESGAADFAIENMRIYMDYQRSLGGLNIFKYEDIIYQKRSWVSQLSELMQARLTVDEINEIADANDILPEKERPDQHVRQVHPGNYRLQLSKMNVERLQDSFREVFEFYGYAID